VRDLLSIEDATGDSDKPIYSFDLAVERVRAAVAAKTRSEFLITARAGNFIYGRPDLEDTIRRLQAFEAAGADVVYAPGLRDIESVKKICRSVSIPVNVVVGLCASTYTVEDLSSVGVRRISTGGSLARAALGEMIRAAQELKDCGTFEYSERAISDAAAARQMRTVARASG
jgi:2-methylisocitrate lyase-like PEP mutase family enzyme